MLHTGKKVWLKASNFTSSTLIHKEIIIEMHVVFKEPNKKPLWDACSVLLNLSVKIDNDSYFS